MASIRENKREDGSIRSYQVLYRIDGRQSSLPLADHKSAEELKELMNRVGVKAALELHGFSAEPVRGPSAGMTVAQWVEHHIEHLTGKEQYTLDKYRAYLRNDIAPILGAIPLAALRSEDVSRWVQIMEATPRRGKLPSPKTITNKVRFLAGALNVAVLRGKIAANPAKGVGVSRGERADMVFLSHTDFAQLLAAVDEFWRPLVEFLVASGCRWGEATALRPADVDRAAGIVRVRRAWKYSPTKSYYIGAPKTRRSTRDVSIPVSVLDKLDYTGEWLFVNHHGGPVRSHGFHNRVWKRAVPKSALDPKPRVHDLRHTHASWLLVSGTPIAVLSRRLGHESIQTTVDVYGHLDRSSDQGAADAIAAILG